jgi:Tfp pilus assembly protein PilN
VLLGVAILLAILLVVLLIVRTRRQSQEANWQRLTTPAIAAAELARDLVLSQSETDDPQRRAGVTVQVDQAVAGLERAAASAPDETQAAMCTRCAESLRGLAFAVEADHLMRSGGQHPTGEQLAAADAARRNRTAELEAALRDLKATLPPSK